MRHSTLLAASMLLVACAGEQTSGEQGIHATVELDGSNSGVVEVAIQNIPAGERVSAIELVGPDGAVYPARSLETETVDLQRVPAGAGPMLGLGVGGGSRGNVSTGVGLGWTFGGGGYSPRTERRTVGRIAIPDPGLYRQTVHNWQVVIKVADQSGGTSLFTIPAPRQ